MRSLALTPAKDTPTQLFLPARQNEPKIHEPTLNVPILKHDLYCDVQTKACKQQELDTCTFNKHDQSGRIERFECESSPSHPESIRVSRYETPSVPMTKPIRLAVIIARTLKTPPRAQTCRYHALSPNCSVQREINYPLLVGLHEPCCAARSSERRAPVG